MKCNVCNLYLSSHFIHDKLIYAFDKAWCVWHYEDMKERL